MRAAAKGRVWRLLLVLTLVLFEMGWHLRGQIAFWGVSFVALPRLEALALLYALLSVVAAGHVVGQRMVRRRAVGHRTEWQGRQSIARSALTGLVFFALPALALRWSEGWVSSSTAAALFTTVPVFAMVFEPYFGADDLGAGVLGADDGPARVVRGGMAAGLMAVAGALLVFPVSVPGSLGAAFGFMMVIGGAASLGAGTCLAVREAGRQPLAPMAAVSGATASLVLVAFMPLWDRPVWRWQDLGFSLGFSLIFELPGLLLLFWLLKRLRAVDLATRPVFAPLMTIVGGMALLQLNARPRTWLGLGMMAAGAGYLVLASGEETEPSGGQVLPLR